MKKIAALIITFALALSFAASSSAAEVIGLTTDTAAARDNVAFAEAEAGEAADAESYWAGYETGWEGGSSSTLEGLTITTDGDAVTVTANGFEYEYTADGNGVYHFSGWEQ